MRIVGMVGDKIPAHVFDAHSAQKRIPIVEVFCKARRDAFELQGCTDGDHCRKRFRLNDGLMQCQPGAGGETGHNYLFAAGFQDGVSTVYGIHPVVIAVLCQINRGSSVTDQSGRIDRIPLGI